MDKPANQCPEHALLPPHCLLQLIRELGNINVKKKEPPFCYPYSLKARVLVLAHLARMEVSDEIEEGSRRPTSRSQRCPTLRGV